MGKLPAFQFYPGDWIQDTRPLSLAAKGAWIDILCALFWSETRGRKTLDLEAWSRTISASKQETEQVIAELIKFQICTNDTEENGNVTLINRRMERDQKVREQTRKRVGKFRNAYEDAKGNAKVTSPSSSSSSSSSSFSTSKIKRKEEEQEKEPYGEFQRVRLTLIEFQKLTDKFGEVKAGDLIQELDTAIESKGLRYKSHYATLLNWAKRKGMKERPGKSKEDLAISDEEHENNLAAFNAVISKGIGKSIPTVSEDEIKDEEDRI